MAETLNEIMADKLVSLVSCQAYFRYRDIWDLRWLKTQGALPNKDFVNSKIQDYNVVDYFAKLERLKLLLPEIIHGREFKEQMSRFLPMDVQKRTIDKLQQQIKEKEKTKLDPVKIKEETKNIETLQTAEQTASSDLSTQIHQLKSAKSRKSHQ